MALVRALSDPAADAPTPHTRLSTIGFDSLAFAELATALQDELGVDLGGAELDAGRTVGDVLDAVEAARKRSVRASSRPMVVSSDRPPDGIGRLQAISRLLGGWAIRWWFGLEVRGAERVPASGAAILAMNHESALDIPVAVLACPRPVTFMAKQELFKNAFVGWALHELGGFRVDRERFDLPAVRIALAAVGRGDVLGMYPEGTRSPGTLLPFLHGAAWLALRTGTPVVPCSILRSEHAAAARWPGRVRVRAAFGLPIAVDPVQDPRRRRLAAVELTARVRAAIETGLEHRG